MNFLFHPHILEPETPVIRGTVPGLRKITVEFERGEPSERVDEFHVNYTTPNGTVSMNSLPGTSGSVSLTEDIQPCVKYEISLWATNGVGASNAARVVAYAFSTSKWHISDIIIIIITTTIITIMICYH